MRPQPWLPPLSRRRRPSDANPNLSRQRRYPPVVTVIVDGDGRRCRVVVTVIVDGDRRRGSAVVTVVVDGVRRGLVVAVIVDRRRRMVDDRLVEV